MNKYGREDYDRLNPYRSPHGRFSQQQQVQVSKKVMLSDFQHFFHTVGSCVNALE